MRVIVTGSRGWHDRERIADRLADLVLANPGQEITIVVGYDPDNDRPRGADRIAYQEAQKHGLLVETHPAEWERGRNAGYVRNAHMASLGADLCLAFWDGRSAGTADMIDKAEARGIPVETLRKEGE